MVDTDKFTDHEILARTAWGEFRSHGEEGMQTVLNTVCNRLASGITWWGASLRDICLHPKQYSCWNASDPNRPKIMAVTVKDPQYVLALGLAEQAMSARLPDITKGADSYFDERLKTWPKWCAGLQPLFFLHPHRYFRVEEPKRS